MLGSTVPCNKSLEVLDIVSGDLSTDRELYSESIEYQESNQIQVSIGA